MYSTPLVSGGLTFVTTGNSPLSEPPTILKLKTPSCWVTITTSLSSLAQWPGPSLSEWLDLMDELLESRGKENELFSAAFFRDESEILLGVIGRLRLFFNMFSPSLYSLLSITSENHGLINDRAVLRADVFWNVRYFPGRHCSL